MLEFKFFFPYHRQLKLELATPRIDPGIKDLFDQPHLARAPWFHSRVIRV
jgi:hypothetical protein